MGTVIPFPVQNVFRLPDGTPLPLPRELPPSTLPWLAGEMRTERQRELGTAVPGSPRLRVVK